MINTLLFDLDGTLLDLDQDEFLRYYFHAMTRYALEWDYQQGDFLVEQIWMATECMIADLNPELTNEEVFMQNFLPRLNCDPARIMAFFDSFYTRHFPLLQKYSGVFPSIPAILDQAFARGYRVVIATNPVFPAAAQWERLKWAGAAHFPYELVTTYENMHFCKPQPHYYREIAEIAGVAPEECLMIGNDTREDLVAGTIGMKTFLLKNGLIDRGDGYTSDWEGYLPDLEKFINALPPVLPK